MTKSLKSNKSRFPKHKAVLLSCLAMMVLLALLAWAVWMMAPCFCSDPFPELRKQTPVRAYYDRHGHLLHLERTYDYQWRFDISLEDVSPEVIRVILATEDAHFYEHHGVDIMAVLRATWQNLANRRIMSGASTITMQLVSIARPRKRSYMNKFIQAAEARLMERHHTKQEILQEYLNRIPFGGKIHGIQAAAIYYFGLEAKDLNCAEASLLCGLPQRPNAFRPDRHPERARWRQKFVLKLMERNGQLKPGEGERIYENEPLRLRDFKYPSAFRTYMPPEYRQYLALAKREAGHDFQIHCALDPEYTTRIHHVLQERVKQLPGVQDAAAVLIDNRGNQILSMVGTLNFNQPVNGQVNAATAIRSAGSVLKPFIYLEAFDAGLVTMDTVIKDVPIRYENYTPANYDGNFNEQIRIAEALSQSLNTPAVRLLALLTPARLVRRFDSLHLTAHDNRTDYRVRHHGLDIALGTMGHSLLDIARAYTVIPNQGKFTPASFLTTPQSFPPENIFSPASCAMTTRILTLRGLPGTNLDIAWKTGTSSGNHDAWCFGYTPDYTLGVWFGNKNGKPASVLVGVSAAAPAIADIFNAIYRSTLPPPWPDTSSLFSQKPLCSKTGLAITPVCQDSFNSIVLNDIPLRKCDQCGVFATPQHIVILSPKPERYVANPNGLAHLWLQSSLYPVHWYIDGEYLGKFSTQIRHSFPPGRHVIHAIDPNDKAISDKLSFSVESN